jgi:hypothetical protein
MKKYLLIWASLCFLYAPAPAQSTPTTTCEDELNAANLELSNKRIQEYAWEQTRKKLLDSFALVKKEAKIVEDSIITLQQELKDKIVLKTIVRKTGRILPEGVYFSNENRRYAAVDTAVLYFAFDTDLMEVPFDLVKEKNKVLITSVENYKIQRISNLLNRYLPLCRLRLKVYYPAGQQVNVSPKRSAEFAAGEFTTLLMNEFEAFLNAKKIEVQYAESADAKPHIALQLTNKLF